MWSHLRTSETGGAPATCLLLVSDLHMAAAQGPYGDPLADDTAIAATLQWFAAQLEQPTRLVILGDLLDFVLAPPHARRGAPADDLAAAKLEAMAPRTHACSLRWPRLRPPVTRSRSCQGTTT